MKILITGASGQLGLELRDIFAERKDIESFFLGRKELPLEQVGIIQDILAIYQPEVIIHAGAYTAVDLAESEPELADLVNHMAVEEIAQYCRIHGVRLIAISTDYVFNGTSSSPLNENSLVSPINVYGETKLKGEQVIQKWLPEGIIIRTSWVYSVYGKNFVNTMIKLMFEREEINVINDQIGSPTYAHDLAKAITHIIDSKRWKGGIYNFSNEGEISWYDFAKAIKEITQSSCRINAIPTQDYPTPAKRPKYSLLDKSKIKSTYKINVPEWRNSLEKMLKKINT